MSIIQLYLQPSQNVFGEQVIRKVETVLVPEATKQVPKGHKLGMFPLEILEI